MIAYQRQFKIVFLTNFRIFMEGQEWLSKKIISKIWNGQNQQINKVVLCEGCQIMQTNLRNYKDLKKMCNVCFSQQD